MFKRSTIIVGVALLVTSVGIMIPQSKAAAGTINVCGQHTSHRLEAGSAKAVQTYTQYNSNTFWTSWDYNYSTNIYGPYTGTWKVTVTGNCGKSKSTDCILTYSSQKKICPLNY